MNIYSGNDTMRGWDAYTQDEMAPIGALCVEWVAARERRDFGLADSLRKQMLDAGVLLDTVSTDGNFAIGPMRESSAHRQQRLSAIEKL